MLKEIMSIVKSTGTRSMESKISDNYNRNLTPWVMTYGIYKYIVEGLRKTIRRTKIIDLSF